MSQAEELQMLGLEPTDEEPLSPAETARWLEALSSASNPDALTAADNARLVERSLEDPLAPPSAAELAAAAELRDALETGSNHPDAELLTALRAPFASSGGGSDGLSQLAPALEARTVRRNVIYVAFGAGGLALAAAAGVLLALSALSPNAAPPASARLARPRSTAPLFSGPFDSDATARVDQIAAVRGRDLRENRYAAWGVR